MGDLHLYEGRSGEARACFDAALAAGRAVGDRNNEGHVLRSLGDLNLEQGQLDEARAHVNDGERRLREVDDPFQLSALLCTRARLEAQARDLAEVRAALEGA